MNCHAAVVNHHVKQDAKQHASDLAAEVSSTWSRRDFKIAFAKLRAMGACSRRKKSFRPHPLLHGHDGQPLRDFIVVADSWVEHSGQVEAAPVIPFSDLD
eukprot:5906021-Pyramimonas_sp.AAC.1